MVARRPVWRLARLAANPQAPSQLRIGREATPPFQRRALSGRVSLPWPRIQQSHGCWHQPGWPAPRLPMHSSGIRKQLPVPVPRVPEWIARRHTIEEIRAVRAIGAQPPFPLEYRNCVRHSRERLLRRRCQIPPTTKRVRFGARDQKRGTHPSPRCRKLNRNHRALCDLSLRVALNHTDWIYADKDGTFDAIVRRKCGGGKCAPAYSAAAITSALTPDA